MERLMALVIMMMLGLGPLGQAASLTPENIEEPEIFMAPPSSPVIDVQNAREMLSNIDGFFTENFGQLGESAGRLYCVGSPLSVAFGGGWVAYDYRPLDSVDSVLLRMTMENSNQAEPVGLKPLPHKNNYFIGNDPERWVTGAGNYKEVHYPSIYDGIDLMFHLTDHYLKYEFVVLPGADPDDIQIRYDGMESVSVDGLSGDLLIKTSAGTLSDEAPYAYQGVESANTDVECTYQVSDDGYVTFQVGDYDRSCPLIIDPGLEFSTYIGGSRNEGLSDFEVDAQGNSYACGRADGYGVSNDFPSTPGAYQNTSDGQDGFLVKLNSSGAHLDFATFIGGNGFPTSQGDQFTSITLDDYGNVCVGGNSGDDTFPTTPGVIRRNKAGGYDAVLVMVSHNGSALLFSTFIGGTGNDVITHIDVFPNGTFLINGNTHSDDFPVVNGCFDTQHDQRDTRFLSLVNSDVTNILRSTYLSEMSHSQLSNKGDVIIYGFSQRSGWPPTNSSSYQATFSGVNCGFIARMDIGLSSITASTYLGGSGVDLIDAVGEGTNGSIYGFGYSRSSDFPTSPNAYQSNNQGVSDMIYTILSPDLSELYYGTYFGGPGSEEGAGMVTPNGDVILWGWTGYSSGPIIPITEDAYDTTHNGKWDGFITRFNPDGNITYSTFIGGSEDEGPGGYQTIHHDVNTTICGVTTSDDFPTTPGAFDETGSAHSYGNMFITRLWTGPPNNADVPTPPRNLTATPGDRVVNLTWDPPADNGGALIGLYNIYRGQTDDAVNELIASTPILRFKDEPDRMGVTYYYAVTASNFRHESNQSGIKNTTVYGSPLEPVGFNAISGCSTVYLSWSPPDDTGGLPILGYIIYRGTGVGSPSRYDEVGNDTTYEDRTVENGKIYHYKVQAFNEMGTGEPTFLRTATPKGPPSEPIFFIVQAGDGEVRLDWGNPANDGGLPLQGYWVHRGTSEDSLLPLERLGMDTETYTDTGLNNGVAYYYAIRAFNLLGNGTFTRILDAMPVGLPGAPAELEAKESDGQVTLSWKQPLDTGGAAINFYELQRGTEMTTLGPLAEWDGTEYVDTGLVNGQIYHYRLRASNVVGVGPWSDVVSATPHRVPDEPAGLMATVDPGRIELIWTPPMDTGGFPVTSFHIYRGDDLYTMELYQEVDPWTTSYLDSEVEGGRTYHYMVTAVTDAGEGPPSAILSRLATGPPGSPLDLRAEAGDGQVTLTWAEPERDGGLPVTGYIVLKGLSELGLTEVANLGPVLGYTDTAVENDRTYHYAVVALNDAGDGLPSDIANATPRRVLLRPGPPLSLEAEVDGDEVALRWRSPLTDGGSPVLGYLVLRGSSPDDMAVIGQTGIVLVYVDRGLEEGTTYHYAVAARNMVGEGDPSGAEDVTIRRSEEVSASTLPILLILCACVVVAGVASTLSTESGRYRWALLLGPLTTRLKRDEVLDNKTRHALLGIIITSPGIHYQAIMREFDLSNGVAAYHLDVLERENYIRSVRDGRLKRFYSTDVKVPRDRRATPEELRHEILDLVISRPGVSQKEVVNELGIESDTVGYHLRAMVTDGTIKDERMGKYMTYYRET